MRNLTLLTDLYEITMAYGFYRNGKHEEEAVFDIFFRQNNLITYSLAAGLEQAMEYLLGWHFSNADIDYLRSLKIFGEDFLEYLRNMRFTGDVYAVKEGEPVFPGEPILTIKAPLIQAQFAETAPSEHHQSSDPDCDQSLQNLPRGGQGRGDGVRASAGAGAGRRRIRRARRGHRGCSSTSNVLAGQLYDIPVSGTMAHSWVMDFDSEYEAFRAYAEAYPENCLLLVDTYDTLRSGVPNAIRVFRELAEKGYRPKGIRLDSGDFAYLSKKARKMLDEAGFSDAIICASGDLDEYSISSLMQQGAKIDLWGVGTKLITSADMPALGGVYKLAAIIKEDGTVVPKIKLSDNAAKITNPSFKNLYRLYDRGTGMAVADLITLREEEIDEAKPLKIFHPLETWKRFTVKNFRAEPLLHTIVEKGKLVYEFPELAEIRAFSARELSRFWEEYLRLDMPELYKVDLSEKLHSLKSEMLDRIRGQHSEED